MPNYIKKPLVIKAAQFTGTPESAEQVAEELEIVFSRYEFNLLTDALDIHTREKGTISAHAGDWIIKDNAGEFFVCSNEIFNALYERAPVKRALFV